MTASLCLGWWQWNVADKDDSEQRRRNVELLRELGEGMRARGAEACRQLQALLVDVRLDDLPPDGGDHCSGVRLFATARHILTIDQLPNIVCGVATAIEREHDANAEVLISGLLAPDNDGGDDDPSAMMCTPPTDMSSTRADINRAMHTMQCDDNTLALFPGDSQRHLGQHSVADVAKTLAATGNILRVRNRLVEFVRNRCIDDPNISGVKVLVAATKAITTLYMSDPVVEQHS